MTALHHVVQSFYNYKEEQLNLINKLLDCGANLNARNNKGQTPLMLARLHTKKGTVMGENLLLLLQQRLHQKLHRESQQRLENTICVDSVASSSKPPESGQSHLLSAVRLQSPEQALHNPSVHSTSSSSCSSHNPGLFLKRAPDHATRKGKAPNESVHLNPEMLDIKFKSF